MLSVFNEFLALEMGGVHLLTAAGALNSNNGALKNEGSRQWWIAAVSNQWLEGSEKKMELGRYYNNLVGHIQ